MNRVRPQEVGISEGEEGSTPGHVHGIVVNTDTLVADATVDDVEPRTVDADVPFAVRIVDRALKVMDWILEVFALGALTVLMLATVANAAMRYLFQSPIQGSMNVTLLYLMPAVVFLALPRVQSVGAHISATLVVDRLSPQGRLACRFVVTVIMVLIMAVMLQGALHELAGAWGSSLGGQPPLPLGPSWLFVAVGLAGAVVRGIWQLITIKVVRPANPEEQERDSDVI